MIDYKYYDLFLKNSIPKQIKIEFENVTLTNVDLYNQEMTLEESICSEPELRFGSCEASVLKFKISDIFTPMIGKWINVKMILNGNSDAPFDIGTYKVNSDNISSDRKYREIIAYDSMYDIINSSAISWYNEILPDNNSKVTMRQFRESFMNHFGLEEVLPVIGKDENLNMDVFGLVNDDMIVENTIQVEEGTDIENETEQISVMKDSALSGLDVIQAICEINGCFGHIGRDGKFHYIYLPQAIEGLYPSDNLFPDHAPEHMVQSKTGHLYPQDPSSYRIGGDKYIKCEWEDFFTERITKLQIRQEENDIGKIWPEEDLKPEDNCYIIQNNFLVYGKSEEDLKVIAKNIFEKITDIVYMPFTGDVMGNPCLEVGDPVRLPTKYEIVESYILKRTLKGIQALRDDISADGVKKYEEKVNGVQESIIQLKGKTNTLYRNVEETRSELRNTEKQLSTRITQNAESITLEAERAAVEENKLSGSIEVLAGKVVLKVDDNGNIAMVSLEADPENGTIFKVGTQNIELTAEETIDLIAGGTINLTGKRIKIESDNFSVDEFGNLTATSARVIGDLSGSTINNGNGTFSVDESGHVIMHSAEVTGEITGSEIIGSTITGGEVNGATIKAKEGLYLQYTNNNTRPPISGEYVFAKTGYDSGGNGGASNDSFLNIDSPSGTVMIAGIMALHDFDVSPSLKFANTAYFPGGFITSNAQINALQETHRKSVYKTVLDEDGNIAASVDSVIKVFGAFVCIYGTYKVNSQSSGEAKYFQLGDSGDDYIPKWAAVRTVSSESGKMFMFTLDSSGRFIASNKSGSNITSSISMTFRLDFIRT